DEDLRGDDRAITVRFCLGQHFFGVGENEMRINPTRFGELEHAWGEIHADELDAGGGDRRADEPGAATEIQDPRGRLERGRYHPGERLGHAVFEVFDEV